MNRPVTQPDVEPVIEMCPARGRSRTALHCHLSILYKYKIVPSSAFTVLSGFQSAIGN